MRTKAWLLVLLLCVLSAASDKSKGTLPHGSADSYPAHAHKPGVSVGAMLLSGKQVRQTFGVDMGNCCLVVEVALYPPKDETMKVSLSDFALVNAGKDVGAKPSTPELVASLLEDRSYPVARDEQKGVHTHSGIGYESGGYDPQTGRRTPGGISTSAGVGVGVGAPPTHAGQLPHDRSTMQEFFAEKELPEGTVMSPVAGYLYFSIPDKHDRKARHQLQCSLNGEKIVLPLDSK
jgi:hypothetical protein